jgi:putative MATE family efflux protein
MDATTGAEARTKMLGSGTIGQVIMRMSMPSIISMVGVGVFYLADAAFISRLGTTHLGAISVSFPLFAVVGGIGQAFGTGAASLISRFLGAGDRESAQRVASSVFFTALITGVIVAGVVIAMLEPLLRLIGASEAVLPLAIQYSRIIVAANVLTMLNITMASIVRAEGNARLSMASVLLSSGLNIILDPLLIFTAGFGLEGAAAATLIAQCASFVLLSTTFYRKRHQCKISVRLWRKGLRYIPSVLRIGAASFFLQFLGSSALAVTNKMALAFGDHAVAAVGLTFRFLALGMYPVYGFTVGFQPVVGYSYGAKNFDRLMKALRTAVFWTLSFSLVFSAALVIWARPVVGRFSGDAEVVATGARMLRAVAFFFPLFNMQIVMAVFFQALGRGVSAALIILSRQALFFYPAILVLPRFIGLDGVIYSQPVADVLTATLASVLTVLVLRGLGIERSSLLTNEQP